MTTDEAARLHLYDMARAAFDDAAADTLMTWLTRDPDRLATKDDLATLDRTLLTAVTTLEAKMTVMEANLRGEFKAALSEQLRTLFFGMIASQATLVGLSFAAAQFG